MMGYDGGWSMMGGMGVFGAIAGTVIVVDLILLGAWLWKKIQEK